MRKILTVDDSPVVRKLMERMLRSLGYEPVTANDGQEGLRRFNENDIPLVITDLNMPLMNGIAFTRALRGQNATIPILILTTESDEALVKEAILAGANAWIEKPPVESVVRENINNLLPGASVPAAAYPLL